MPQIGLFFLNWTCIEAEIYQVITAFIYRAFSQPARSWDLFQICSRVLKFGSMHSSGTTLRPCTVPHC